MPRHSLRTLVILKFVPAVLCGLLLVAWAVSMDREFGAIWQAGRGHLGIACDYATLHLWNDTQITLSTRLFSGRHHPDFPSRSARWSGRWSTHAGPPRSLVCIPLPLLLTLLAPVAAGVFMRFPLWSYFAWTAIVAAELAYYLR